MLRGVPIRVGSSVNGCGTHSVSFICSDFAVSAIFKARWTSNIIVGIVGKFALTGALVLYPTVITDVCRLLHCTLAVVSPAAYASLDGGGSAESLDTVSVMLLDDNPYIVCWSGSHLAAGRLALVTAAVYIVCLPFWTLAALWTDPLLRHHFNIKHHMDVKFDFSHTNPLIRAQPRRATPKIDGAHLLTAMNVQADPILSPFLADYKIQAWWFKHTDLLVVSVLAAFQGSLPRPSVLSLSQSSKRLCAVVLWQCFFLLLGSAVHTRRRYVCVRHLFAHVGKDVFVFQTHCRTLGKAQ